MNNLNLAVTYDVDGILSLPKEGEITVMRLIEVSGQDDRMYFKTFDVKNKSARSILREIALDVYHEEREESRIFRMRLAFKAHHSLALEVMSVCLKQTRNFASWNLKHVVQVTSATQDEQPQTAAMNSNSFADSLNWLVADSEQRDEYGPRRVLLVRKKWHHRRPKEPAVTDASAEIELAELLV